MHQKNQKIKICLTSAIALIKPFLFGTKKFSVFVLIIFLSGFPNPGITQTDESIVPKESFQKEFRETEFRGHLT